MQKGVGNGEGGGKLKPLPEKLFFIPALTERLTLVTSLKGLLHSICLEHWQGVRRTS